MVYNPHMYLWSRTDSQADLAAYVQMAPQQRVPLWIGDFGENFPSQVALHVQQFSAQPTVAGWAFWPWKKVPNWAGCLECVTASPKVAGARDLAG